MKKIYCLKIMWLAGGLMACGSGNDAGSGGQPSVVSDKGGSGSSTTASEHVKAETPMPAVVTETVVTTEVGDAVAVGNNLSGQTGVVAAEPTHLEVVPGRTVEPSSNGSIGSRLTQFGSRVRGVCSETNSKLKAKMRSKSAGRSEDNSTRRTKQRRGDKSKRLTQQPTKRQRRGRPKTRGTGENRGTAGFLGSLVNIKDKAKGLVGSREKKG